MNEQNVLFEEYEPIKQALKIGNFLSRIKKPENKEKKKRGITNPRQFFMKEIQEIIELENGAKMSKKDIEYLCCKLSHVPTDDLPFMKSQGLDYRNRNKEPFAKYIFGSVKTKDLSTV